MVSLNAIDGQASPATLAFLALRQDSYIFQDLTAAQIIKAVFAEHPSAHVELRLSEPLRVRSLCIQYDETDLDFVRRLLAEEGLSTRIEQLDADAARQADAAKHARHKLIICDRTTEADNRPDLGRLRFTSQHITANLDGQRDAITAFEATRRLTPNAIALGSWEYRSLVGPNQVASSRALATGQCSSTRVAPACSSMHTVAALAAATCAAMNPPTFGARADIGTPSSRACQRFAWAHQLDNARSGTPMACAHALPFNPDARYAATCSRQRSIRSRSMLASPFRHIALHARAGATQRARWGHFYFGDRERE